MNQKNYQLLTLALLLGVSAGAMAQGMSMTEYKASKRAIVSEYAAVKVACAAASGNAKDICVAETKGKERVAKAELQARYKPSLQAHHKTRMATVQANYNLAKQRCDNLAGNPKDVCVKEAAAALSVAEADATVQLKTAQAKAGIGKG